MNGRLFAVLLLCLPAVAQDRFRRPQFPPDVIAHDSPIRDLAKLDTKHVRVDSDTARMRVLRITLAAGELLPMHDSRDGVIVCVVACSIAITNPVGYVRDVKMEAGQTLSMSAERHRFSNTGAATELLYIEFKKPAN
jgi:hypothetical protein